MLIFIDHGSIYHRTFVDLWRPALTSCPSAHPGNPEAAGEDPQVARREESAGDRPVGGRCGHVRHQLRLGTVRIGGGERGGREARRGPGEEEE